MKNEKTKVLVVYEDGRDTLEAMAKRMKISLVDKASIKARCASEVAVAEILAADAYVFGVSDAGATSWSEMKRLLAGMNLAGRKAAFFTDKAGAAEGLRTAFVPAELTVSLKDLIGDKADHAGDWVQALIVKK
ncbi:MAG: hypothetical protein RBT62_11015 [Spirochaetia bacterium]|nr:hypothetical protein [Spirochaetia bacterium]